MREQGKAEQLLLEREATFSAVAAYYHAVNQVTTHIVILTSNMSSDTLRMHTFHSHVQSDGSRNHISLNVCTAMQKSQ